MTTGQTAAGKDEDQEGPNGDSDDERWSSGRCRNPESTGTTDLQVLTRRLTPACNCGLRNRASYEGQAASELENVADDSCDLAYPFSFVDGVLDGVGLIRALAEDLVSGRPVPEAAAGFHNGVASGLIDACLSARTATGLGVVALSGGTWQNMFLLRRVWTGLQTKGFEVLVHRQVPCNDGGISLGQAVVANALRETPAA